MSGFIDRNRVFWMQTRGAVTIKSIINDDLFSIPNDVASLDDVAINLKHSNRPLAVGIISYINDGTREYLAYGNDSAGKVQWIEGFNKFKDALFYAKNAYINDIDEMYHDYMYEESAKVSRR